MRDKMAKKTKVELEIERELKRLVIARIKVASGNLRVSVGNMASSFSKDELIRSVEKGDEIGQEVMNAQLEYLKDLAQGALYTLDGDSNNTT